LDTLKQKKLLAMRRLGIVAGLVGFMALQSLAAQNYQVHKPAPSEAHTVEFSSIGKDYFPSLQQLEAPKPGGEAAEEKLKAIKEAIGPKQEADRTKRERSRAIDAPTATKGFQGNQPDGVPNDNDLAINQNGTIVSVTNSRISIFDTSGQRLDRHSLEAFADTLSIEGNKYDPRVEYDPEADRFVIAYLNGTLDTTSRIIMAFSASADPRGDWNLYSLPGDAIDNGSWSDFPAMALTKDEVFLTVNLLYNDSSWQAGFRQSVIWQLDKQAGYRGEALTQTVYSGITLDGEPIRNLTPVQGGDNLHGPAMHLLSNRNFTAQSKDFFVVTVTGMQDNPNTTVQTRQVTADAAYGAPPQVGQPRRNTRFATNDARILDGYQIGNTIHFVGNSIDLATNRGAIYHGRLIDPESANTLELSVRTHPEKELGYPSIAYGEGEQGQQQGLIIANHSGDSTYPGYSGIRFKGMEHSTIKTLKAGTSSVNRQRAETERWGDYSGLQRRYSSSKTYWAAGYYGYEQNLAKENGTWISRIRTGAPVNVNNADQRSAAAKAYPNPMQERLTVEFNIEKPQLLSFNLYNGQGQRIQQLQQQFTNVGTHAFTFSVAPLAAGNYVLEVQGKQGTIATQKLVK
jgi:hypothetical protein